MGDPKYYVDIEENPDNNRYFFATAFPVSRQVLFSAMGQTVGNYRGEHLEYLFGKECGLVDGIAHWEALLETLGWAAKDLRAALQEYKEGAQT